ncbi:MAG: thiamine diphosphokinase [Treponema sp.]|nr:thiamine diphosphokinase [Treponema sp.]
MSRCVIISAGEIRNYNFARSFLRDDDFYIFCDDGLSHAEGLGIVPNLIVGDFDSCNLQDLKKFSDSKSCQIITLPREKDDTDTFYAVKLALDRGFDDFLFLGAMGGRFDHAFGNVSILLYLYEKNKNAMLADDFSVMRICGNHPIYIEDKCSYFSLLTIAGNVSGVTIKNAKYPLENADLASDFQLGISNEVLPGKKAEVSVEKGAVLIVEVLK